MTTPCLPQQRLVLGVFALAAATAAFSALPNDAAAQTYVCPGGPGPGEVAIAVGSGPGAAGAPICARDPNASDGAPTSAEDLAASYGPGPDPMARKLELAIEMQKALVLGQAAELKRDPRYQRYMDGGWDFFQDAANAKPGELCTAFFTRQDSYVAVTGPGGVSSGAFLTFWGPNVPKPRDVKRVKVSLAQTGGDPAQTVTAFNTFNPAAGIGGITLAVPTADALLNNMLDVHRFTVSMDGRQVAEVEWTGGLAARDRLRACIAGARR